MPIKLISVRLPLLLAILLLAACAALQGGYRLPAVHPEALGRGRPTCTECHEARTETFNYQRFNHDPFFMENHRQLTRQGEAACTMCHGVSFCNDCHVTRSELRPSIKEQTETYRRMPHRGEYLSRHQIEGRIDPISCFRCHGNPKSARTCAPCHP
jgi:hypothetical protein